MKDFVELRQQARAHQASGRIEDAIEEWQRAIAAGDTSAETLAALGHAWRAKRNPQRAADAYRRALAARSDCLEAYLGLAQAYVDAGKLEAAIALCRRVVAIRDNVPEFHAVMGDAQRRSNLPTEAEQSLRRALQLRPDFVPVWNSLGLVLMAENRVVEALDAYRHALSLAPDHVEALNNLGHALLWQGALWEAASAFERAIALKPQLAEPHLNLGIVRNKQDQPERAIEAFDRALQLAPDLDEAHLNRGMALLTLGRFREGWPEYEYRWGGTLAHTRRAFECPLWRGDTSLEGRTILLYAEQGLGDTLQFVRYVPLVAERGASVLLEVQPGLKSLLSGFPGVTAIFGKGDSLPEFDVHCPLLSLPRAFETELDSIPASVPYVAAAAERITAWRKRLDSTPNRLNVGLAWSGNPHHRNDHARSTSYAVIRPIVEEVPAAFYCLQKEVRQSDRDALAATPHVHELAADLDDTAAIISLLDVVITVDTAFAHFAGALGRPVWILLPFSADWRWLRHRSDTPWYPTARLFRQPSSGDWAPVIDEVRRALRDLASARDVPAGRATS